MNTEETSGSIAVDQHPTTSYVTLIEDSSAVEFEFDDSAGDQSSWSTRLAVILSWGRNAYRLTQLALRRAFDEIERSEDTPVEEKIRVLERTRQNYRQILAHVNALRLNFESIVETQNKFVEGHSLEGTVQLSTGDDDLSDELARTKQAQQVLVERGNAFLDSLRTFVAKLETLINVTMEDTFQTVNVYRSSRDQFDVDRHQFQRFIERNSRTSIFSRSPTGNHSEIVLRQFQRSQEIYHRNKQTLIVKLQYLDEHRGRVMRHLLAQLHQSTSIYFSLGRAKGNVPSV